jgi:predicted dehydrogenase
MNSGHLNNFLGRSEVQVVAVCDVDTSRRENAKKTVEERYSKNQDAQFKGCTAYADFRELVANKDIDAVVIATPDHWHTITAIAAQARTKLAFSADALRKNQQTRTLAAVHASNIAMQFGATTRKIAKAA